MRRPHTIAACCLIAAAAALPAAAQQGDRRGAARDDRNRDARTQYEDRRARSRGNDGLSDSIRRIERDTRSQVLSAERVQSDGRDVNRIKAVDRSGRVRVYMDDPQARTRAQRSRRDDD